MQPLPRRPLAGLAIAFLSGTGLGLALPVSYSILFWATAVALAATSLMLWLGAHWHGTASTMILITTLGLGWLNATPAPGGADPAIATLLTLPTGAGMIGIITDEPVCIVAKSGKATWKFPVSIEQVRGGKQREWIQASGTVRVRLFAASDDRIPIYGERWSFGGYLAQALFKQGLFAGKPGTLFFSGSSRKARLLATGAGNPLIAACLRGRTWAGSILAEGITDCPDQSRILNSILLGYYSQIPRDLYQAFARTGTLHVFAISGSHMVIM